ncbi:MAG TPA: hypothetical protein VK527_01035, partial [Candidatus Limnocylindrales bacterium]|nr:hypothetical protein [Candidatus Limnocylindrales bacterium]
MNQADRALADFDTSLALQPGNARAYLWRSGEKLQLGDRSGALRDALRARALGYAVDDGYLDRLRKP